LAPFIALLASLSMGAGRAIATEFDGPACESAADEAERDAGLPAGLLRAIGIVESGRWQPGLGRYAPWPYAIDAGGYSLFMDSLAEAVAKVGALRQEGIESIDVGCFQINLLYHPSAFATLEEGFDPRANAAYAARFLVSLYGRTGTWAGAVSDYHSAVASVGEPYRARVYAVWQGAPSVGAEVRLTVSPGLSGGLTHGAAVPAATRLVGFTSFSLPPSRVAVRVFLPGALSISPQFQAQAAPGARESPSSQSASPPRILRAARRGLPMVFGPAGGRL
jgi:hypothetical protein